MARALALFVVECGPVHEITHLVFLFLLLRFLDVAILMDQLLRFCITKTEYQLCAQCISYVAFLLYLVNGCAGSGQYVVTAELASCRCHTLALIESPILPVPRRRAAAWRCHGPDVR